MQAKSAWAYVLCMGVLVTGPATAAVSAAEAAKLGAALTPSGAEAAGNAAGTIPAWTGSKSYRPEQLQLRYADLQALRQKQPEAVQAAIAPKDAGDKPRFVISKANAAQYASQLSAGQRALLEQVPEFQMRVFPSLRPAFNLPAVDAASRANALSASLEGTDKLSGAKLGVPFPIPQNGAEVIWNHKLKFRGSAVRRYNNEVIVARDGSYQLARIVEDVKLKYGDPKAPSPIEDGLILYYLQEVLSPKRIAGQLLLVHESTDQTEGGRSAWIYNPGLGRTRRAPNVGYDNPKASADGLMFNDQTDMYNGALDRYSWKLLGKREIYIPYNAYRLSDGRVKYSQLLKAGHPDQAEARYELHRVWVIEATERGGKRHVFGKRTYYVDEDSWNVVLVENEDREGNLWRFQEGHVTPLYDVQAVTTVPSYTYDLKDGRYFANRLFSEDAPFEYNLPMKESDFLPATVRVRYGR